MPPNTSIIGLEFKKIERMSCYGGASFSSCTYDAARHACELDPYCIAVKHLGCGNVDDEMRYVTCGLGSKIGIRMENNFAISDKKDCIYKKITGGTKFDYHFLYSKFS